MSSPIEEIKARLNIIDLIQSYIKLEKAGTNFKARCPFHNEKTPSFFVSPARQMWHCFGCQKGGDHFQFIQEIENVEFPEALRTLAEKTGIELRREDPQIRSERTRLLNLLDDATRFYEVNLARRKDVGAYLSERGMTGMTAKSFRLGYAESGWDNLIDYFRKRGYGENEMEKVGLVVKANSEQPAVNRGFYDRFRSRIMFPLFDSSGRIVSFSGRIFMPDADGQKDAESKYVNTPNTLFYDKSKLLYGFDRAKLEIRKQNAAILVEGQMDLIMSHQAGVLNAIAVSGTALTSYHLNNIKRLADGLIMSFDMDTAGLMASEKAVGLAFYHGFDVKALELAHSKDPADLIRDNPEEWKRIVGEARPVVGFLLDVFERNFSEPRAYRHEVEKRVLPHVASITSDIDRAHWVEEVSGRLKLPSAPVWDAVNKLRSKAAKQNTYEGNPQVNQVKIRKDLIEERILGLAALHSGIPALAECKLEWFSEARREMFRLVLAGNISEDHYLKKLALAAEISAGSAEYVDLEIKSLSKELQRENLKEQLENISVQIREAERASVTEELRQKVDEFKRLSDELHSLR